jgi:hypothetical protein
MSHIKKYITSFDLSHPQWEKFPMELLTQKPHSLNTEEKHVLNAIKMEYFNEHAGSIITRKATKTALYSLVFLFIGLISLISLILLSPATEKFAKPVSAATVSASLKHLDIRQTLEQAYESTVSAVFRK